MEQTLGNRIMQNRKRLGLTQDQLAEKLGVTAQAVSKWENDLSCPDIAMLPKLAGIFGITTDALLGTETDPPVHEAEVVDEEPQETAGIHVQKGDWEFKWDNGKNGALRFALLVLAVGAQLLIATALDRDLTFWSTLWPTALVVYGISGLWPGFSFFRVGCLLFGGYFALENWNALPFSFGKELVFPAILVIFGISLLVDALKKPHRPSFHVNHNGTKRNECRYRDNGFEYKGSFSEDEQHITLPLLASGQISTSFGEYIVDLSGVEKVEPNCRLEASCSFGELTIRVPRRFAVKQTTSTAFGGFEIIGHPDPKPQGTIQLKASTSFGEMNIKYI